MRKTILLVIMTTAIIFSACTGRQAKEKEKALDTIPMMVMQIQKCSRLYTAEAQVHRIITHDDQLRLKGSILKNEFDISLPGGKRKVAIPMDATLKAYIDFKGFNEKNVRRQGEKIEIILPDPKVVLTSSKIDHEGIKKFVSLTRRNFSDEELSSYEQEGMSHGDVFIEGGTLNGNLSVSKGNYNVTVSGGTGHKVQIFCDAIRLHHASNT